MYIYLYVRWGDIMAQWIVALPSSPKAFLCRILSSLMSSSGCVQFLHRFTTHIFDYVCEFIFGYVLCDELATINYDKFIVKLFNGLVSYNIISWNSSARGLK